MSVTADTLLFVLVKEGKGNEENKKIYGNVADVVTLCE